MKASGNFSLRVARGGSLHRHEAYLFKLLLKRRLRWSALLKQLWCLARSLALAAASLFASGELVRRHGPHSRPLPRSEWERQAGGGPPRWF